MFGMIIGNLANIVLDPLMILVFGWDVAGAAIATVIGNVLASLFYLRHLLSGKTLLSIHGAVCRCPARSAALRQSY